VARLGLYCILRLACLLIFFYLQASLSRKGCPGIYSGVNTYIKLDKRKLSRNGNDEKKNSGRNHSQKGSLRGMDIRTMFGYTTKLEVYTG
jgi:hypothetical protein